MSSPTYLRLSFGTTWPLLAAGLLIFSVGLSNLGNYAFNSWVSRALSPAQFGTYGIAFAVITVGAVPINVLRLAVIRETASSPADGRPASGAVLLAHLRRYSSGPLPGLLAFLLVGALAFTLVSPAAGQGPAVAVLAALILGAMCLVYAARGLLQGSFRVGSMTLSVFIEYLLRLCVFGALVSLWASSEVPLIAMLAGLLGSSIVTGRLLGFAARAPAAADGGQDALRRLAVSTALFLVIYVAHTALFSADVILAGFFLDRTQVGEYAALSLAGRIILFANLGVAEFILPVAAAPGQWSPSLVTRSMLLGALAPLPILLVFVLLPQQSLSILFGTALAGLSEYLPAFAAAMYALSLAGIVLSFLLARGLGRYAAMIALAAASAEVFLLLWRHGNAGEIVSDVVIAALAYTAALIVLLCAAGARWRRARIASCEI